MSQPLADHVASRWDAIVADWSRRLHSEQPNSALARPEILAFRMDDTLRQLDALLRAEEVNGWPDRAPPPLLALRGKCRCGMNPLLGYYACGDEALRLAAPAPLPDHRRLQQAWYLLARREIQSLCSVCTRKPVSTATRLDAGRILGQA